ncbi:terminase gpP N-terminus-related DNA-binding protein [Pontibacter flavimaris]|uniref:Terminase ATPase subunit N-terminal domain-containing protein n=1 Tax=Pontibacter flavimaris TaxID=1797110 RepID=A0A1Q5PDF9_9BACT|nr:sigma factor-like helix-turn-helix DNA-binding protein [Pontibacter flavimaris]OKL40278.1 hypothetical protein A3841_18305 [Pontibacter flavimaris]
MRVTSLPKEKKKAFELYAEGKTQKEIGQLLGISEKSIGAWKKRYEWDKKLQEEQKYSLKPTFLVLTEVDKEAIQGNPEASKALKDAIANINYNLKIVHRILTDNNLTPKS